MHDGEKAVLRLAVVARRTAQRLDEAEEVASGVRSSWLALATKSARICSLRFDAVRSCRVSMAARPRQMPRAARSAH